MENRTVRVLVADPTPLGLFGLAIVTLVASSQKMALTDGLSLVIPWAIFLGGIAQLIAAFYDFKHNNVFGATAFGAYGLFWLGVAMSWMINMGILGEKLQAAADTRQMGFVFIGYLLLSITLTISALKMSKGMFLLMFLICLLFVGLAADVFMPGGIWKQLAAIVELLISLVTFYALSAKYLSLYFGKTILPMGKAIA